MIVLILLGTVGGSLIGIAEARLYYTVWPLCSGLMGLVLLLATLVQHWVWRPYERLLSQLNALAKMGDLPTPDALKALSVGRGDEVGTICRLVRDFTASAIRDRHEARQLHRTLDHRITEATALATRKMRKIVVRDPLTNLGNRRFLEENLEPLVGSVLLSASDLVCVMIDMDNFKLVNDVRGHALGDELLVLLADLIRATTREEDYAVRLGGDEFVVLMPNCTTQRAYEFAERLRQLFLQRTRPNFQSDLIPNLSIGIASLCRDHLNSGRELLEKADENLYGAKRKGKARVVGG